jgi:hypothetical protein
MTVKYKNAVQKVRSAYVEADYTDLASGTFVPLIPLPPGALIVGGAAYVLTASDAATSESVAIGTSATANAYGSVSNSKTAGRTALTLPGGPVSDYTQVGLTRTASGAQTAGRYGLYVEYIIASAQDESQA